MSIYGYRRGSIFWALTLIGIGFIFLYQNFNPAVHPWVIIAKFWPILIIFWGLSKLLDFIQSRSHPESAAPPLFSGSEVVLLVLILILGSMISHVVLRPSSWRPWWAGNNEDWADIFRNSYTFTRTISQPVGAQPHFVLVDHRGDVNVHPSDEPTIEAVVKEGIRADDEAAASQLSQELRFTIVQQAGHYLFQSNLESLPEGGGNVRLDVTLRVPKDTSTEITAENGDIVLEGLQGDQTLAAQRGDVHVNGVEGLVRIHKSAGDTLARNITGSIEVEGRGGDVQISDVTGSATVNGEFSGDVRFAHIAQTLRYTSSRTDLTVQRLAGQLDMDMGSLEASNIAGPFDLSTREKDISLSDFIHSVKIADTNGDIRLATSVAPSHPIEVSLAKGGIELELPSNSSFTIQAVSRHGEVESDFSGPNLKVVTEGDAPSIVGSYGKGGSMIRLTTAYGTIHLAQGGPHLAHPPKAPEPPKPPKTENTRYRPGFSAKPAS